MQIKPKAQLWPSRPMTFRSRDQAVTSSIAEKTRGRSGAREGRSLGARTIRGNELVWECLLKKMKIGPDCGQKNSCK